MVGLLTCVSGIENRSGSHTFWRVTLGRGESSNRTLWIHAAMRVSVVVRTNMSARNNFHRIFSPWTPPVPLLYKNARDACGAVVPSRPRRHFLGMTGGLFMSSCDWWAAAFTFMCKSAAGRYHRNMLAASLQHISCKLCADMHT